MRLRGWVQFDRPQIELRRQFQVPLHLQPISVLVKFLGHLESRIRHANVIYVSKPAGEFGERRH